MFLILTVPATLAIAFVLVVILADSELRKRRPARIAALVLAIALLPTAALLFLELWSMIATKASNC